MGVTYFTCVSDNLFRDRGEIGAIGGVYIPHYFQKCWEAATDLMHNLSDAHAALFPDPNRGYGSLISDPIFDLIHRWLKMGKIGEFLPAISF